MYESEIILADFRLVHVKYHKEFRIDFAYLIKYNKYT